ncbi:MAG: helix-turn-helix domain-containing protein [Gemmatimonadota bacterium]|nr:helix-turn-helix domain-containing protein [Gemmatimonadota bacterium]
MSSRERRTEAKAETESFGERLARLREDAGLSQSGVARRIGASQSAVSQLEAGDRSPSYGMLVQLAEALGVSVPYLVGADIEELTPVEEVHFRRYRTLSPNARRELDAYVDFLQTKYAKEKE